MILIGSQALKYHYPNIETNIDSDYIATHDEIENFISKLKNNSNFEITSIYTVNTTKKIVDTLFKGIRHIFEFEIAWIDSCVEEIMNLPDSNQNGIASKNLLFFLKSSHRFLKNSPHFRKTMKHYKFLKDEGCYIPDSWKKTYERREKETYSYSHPKLNTVKNDFFKNEDFYVYDHDTIHLAVKNLRVPIYELFKADNQEVFCDKNKWDKLSNDLKLLAVLEESQVLALERSQIPNDFKIDIDFSFMKALEKVCTSITSGWFREYAYDNYENVINVYNSQHENYVEKFNIALKKGVIKKLKK